MRLTASRPPTPRLPLSTHLAGPVHGWRCRAKLAVRGSAGAPSIGLFEAGSHSVTPMPECRAHHPRINSAAQLVQQVGFVYPLKHGLCGAAAAAAAAVAAALLYLSTLLFLYSFGMSLHPRINSAA